MSRRKILALVSLMAACWSAGFFSQHAWEYIVLRPRGTDPKSAGSEDRERLFRLLDAGYDSAEEAVSGQPPSHPGYFDLVRHDLAQSSGRSNWLKMRLVGELEKSNRLEDAGFLLKVAPQLGPRWLERRALDAAKAIAAKDGA